MGEGGSGHWSTAAATVSAGSTGCVSTFTRGGGERKFLVPGFSFGVFTFLGG